MITFWQLPPDLQQQVLRLPADLAGKLASRIAARTLRRLFLWYGPDFSICRENLSNQNKKKKEKLNDYTSSSSSYTIENCILRSTVYFPLDYSGFPFLKYCYQKCLLLHLWHFASSLLSYSQMKKVGVFFFMMHENLQEHSQSRKDLVWTVIRFTLDSWLIFLDCNMFYLEY